MHGLHPLSRRILRPGHWTETGRTGIGRLRQRRAQDDVDLPLGRAPAGGQGSPPAPEDRGRESQGAAGKGQRDASLPPARDRGLPRHRRTPRIPGLGQKRIKAALVVEWYIRTRDVLRRMEIPRSKTGSPHAVQRRVHGPVARPWRPQGAAHLHWGARGPFHRAGDGRWKLPQTVDPRPVQVHAG